jgi:hypothetical protein
MNRPPDDQLDHLLRSAAPPAAASPPRPASIAQTSDL